MKIVECFTDLRITLYIFEVYCYSYILKKVWHVLDTVTFHRDEFLCPYIVIRCKTRMYLLAIFIKECFSSSRI